MFSSIGTAALPNSRHSQGFGKNYAAQLPKGFSVRVFKGPTLSSFPHTATAKFDIGYHPVPPTIPLAEPRMAQNWFSRTQNTSKSYSPPSESKSSRPQTNSTSATSNRGYDTNSRPPTQSYSIYPNVSNDTYIYERSLSSKSDIYDEDDANSTGTFTPNSVFSPAMSTDSITTLKSPMVPSQPVSNDRDSRSTTPTATAPPRNSFGMQMPGLSHAQSAPRGVFRNGSAHVDISSRADNSYIPHASSSRRSALPDSGSDLRFRDEAPVVQGRSTTPTTRLSSVSSGSDNRGAPRTPTSYLTPGQASYSNQHYAESIISDSDNGELDRIAKINAEHNAASSASYYSSTRRSSDDARTETSGQVPSSNGVETRQIYPNLPLRSSPEQQRAPIYIGTSYTAESSREAPSSSFMTTETTSAAMEPRSNSVPSYRLPQSQFGDRIPDHEEFIPPLAHREWDENMAGRQVAPRRPTEDRGPQIPRFLNEGHQSRYVPASRTMTPHPTANATASSDPLTTAPSDADRRQDRPLPIPPPPSQQLGQQRERRPSVSQPQLVPITQSSSIYNNVRNEVNLGPIPNQPSERNAGAKKSPPGQTNPTSSYVNRESTIPREYPVAPPGNLMVQGSSTGIGPREASVGFSNKIPNYISEREAEASGRISTTQRQSPTIPYPPPPRDAAFRDYSSAGRARESEAPAPQEDANRNTWREQPKVDSTRSYGQGEVRLSPETSNPAPRFQYQAVDQQAITPRRISPTRNPEIPSERYNEGGVRDRAAERGVRTQLDPLPSASRQIPFSGVPQERLRLDESLADPSRSTLSNAGSSKPVPGISGHNNIGRNEQRRASFSVVQREDNIRDASAAPTSNVAGISGRQVENISFPPAALPEERRANLNLLSDAQQASRSRTPFNERRSIPEPHRRRSDGDRSISSDTMPPRNTVSYPSSDEDITNNRASQPTPLPVEPQRRFSDGDQVNLPNIPGRATIALSRNVRWNENLVCPSPIFPNQRRKGWFNRRGDQLWTNTGAYRPLPPGQEYPPDLDGYPEHGEGWMNEEGVRIDLQHRLIPKLPLRSALKQSRPT